MPFRLESGAEPIPGYKLIGRLGGGGFGEVWKAEAPGGLLKAIKFVYGDLQTASSPDGQRAEQELKALSRVKTVRHPYILTLERYDIIDGQLMIVMELADRNLWDRFKECRTHGLIGIPREELLHYMDESAEALDLMNGQYQLQHLDIKPQNVFLIYNHIKVADFGLVKDLQGMTAEVTGGVTPVYAAPETFDGLVSRYCDQYSLAIVFQELLTGQRPFAGTNVHQLIMQHVQGKPNMDTLSPADQQIIGRSLSKSPDERFPTCSDMVRALRAATAGVVVPAAGLPKAPAGAIVGGGPTMTPPPRFKPAPAAEPVFHPHMPAEKSTGAGFPDSPAPVSRPEFQPPTVRPTLTTPTSMTRSMADIALARNEISAAMEAPPEVTGEGALFPAMVIGLGQMGLNVLMDLRGQIKQGFGSVEALPNIRLLYLDTDPDGMQAATRIAQGDGLSATEVVLAKLNRAIHYQKSREGRPRIETWFNTNMLYRIPRNLTTEGLRALGRLALIDNYRLIAPRLRADLTACTDLQNLQSASKQTGLQLRTNRPRIYIVASLAGGTGSGMFIDLAYVMRAMLKHLGYSSPDVHGILMLPAVEASAASKKALVNTVAALTELNHFSTPGNTFSARFDDREPPVADKDPPFTRSFLFAPAKNEEGRIQEMTALAADFLYRNMTTALGRTADESRARLPASNQETPTMLCQALGLFRFSWPRRPLLRRAARRYSQALVQRWMSKDTVPFKEEVKTWIQEQWTQKELSAEFMIERLQAACDRALGGATEAAFTALAEPFLPKGRRGPEIDPNAFWQAVNHLDSVVGHPTASQVGYTPGKLEETLRKESEKLLGDWQHKLENLTMRLVEQPEFRLAGAEEAIRRAIRTIDEVLQHHEPISQELAEKSAKVYDRLRVLMPNIQEIVKGGRRVAPMLTELSEFIKSYPKWRYQSLVLRQVNSVFTNLRGFLSDKVREVGFCRTRLGELERWLSESSSDRTSEQAGGTGNYLFPAGCSNLQEALDRLIPTITKEDLDELDVKIQELIRQQFTALLHVCMTASNLLKNLEGAMLAEAEVFAATRLQDADVVDMYLSRHTDQEETLNDLTRAFDEATPKLAPAFAASLTESCILATPPSPQEQRFRELARRAIPDAELVPAPSEDDIVFYREETQLPLGSLNQFGPSAQELYQQMSSAEHFTLHSRNDVEWRQV